MVAGIEVDCLWESARLVLELDSWGSHRSRRAFERDLERDAKLLVAGYRTIRITGRRLEEKPDEVARELRELLGG